MSHYTCPNFPDHYTFDADQLLVHLPMAQPYCQHIRRLMIRELSALKMQHRPDGCVVVIQGPRFSTIAESKMHALLGGDIVNMTQYPECYYARELGICYGVVASVTDYDVGVPSALSMQSGSRENVLEVFRVNTEKTIRLLGGLLGVVKEVVDCRCAEVQKRPYYPDP